MRKLLLAALSAALLVPGSAMSAQAKDSTSTRLTASTRATVSTRASAFATADRYAAQAPRLSTAAKARNADTLARVMRIPSISVRERGLAIARTQLGTQYRWGGTTPAGFDCSGLTSFAYAKAGKKLPRTADAQRRALKRTTSPRYGDLVFIGAPAYHVGIYVGNGKILHSPRSGKAVQVARIWTKATYGRM